MRVIKRNGTEVNFDLDKIIAAITAANESVELRSFKEIIPSMNDIFIRAVGGNL
jgi:ABC-2 type transport system ATP-binding protein